MESKFERDACREAYNEVRADETDTNWAAFTYDNKTIVCAGQGTDYEDFKKMCTDDSCMFGFIRIKMGDAMSKRYKFTFITWVGKNLSGMKLAKISTDKALVKEVVQNFAKEFNISEFKELDEDLIRMDLKKAGGANYDAQTE